MRLCTTTGKRGYGSTHAARRQSRGTGQKLRVYLCPHCHLWHATKQATSGVEMRREPPRRAPETT